MLRKGLIIHTLSATMSGCSLAPVVAPQMGLGTANETDIQDATSKVFGVSPSSVKVSSIVKDDGFNGTRIYYNASVSGKNYRCGMLSSFAGSSLPKCVKPGEPLTLQ